MKHSHSFLIYYVKSNYVIAFTKFGDWRLTLAPVFQPMRSKPLASRMRKFGKFRVIARNTAWFIAKHAPVVISQSNYFGIPS